MMRLLIICVFTATGGYSRDSRDKQKVEHENIKNGGGVDICNSLYNMLYEDKELLSSLLHEQRWMFNGVNGNAVKPTIKTRLFINY